MRCYANDMDRMQLPGGHVTLIDEEDRELVAGFRWRILKLKTLRYVHAWRGSQHFYLHRLILGAPSSLQVDHINGDGLDNRRSNLRLATRSQNLANRGSEHRKKGKTSRFKGVYFVKRDGNWGATIHVNRKTRALGQFAKEEDAAAAYDLAALEIWGSFAKTNAMLHLGPGTP